MDVLKMSFVRYECLKEVCCIFNVLKTSFVCYWCLKDIVDVLKRILYYFKCIFGAFVLVHLWASLKNEKVVSVLSTDFSFYRFQPVRSIDLLFFLAQLGYHVYWIANRLVAMCGRQIQ